MALPTIGRSLQVTPALSVLIITAYQLAIVIAALPCGALGESFGYRRVFTLGVILFTAASALCALSPSLPWLIAARALQGLGGAAIMSLAGALLRMIVAEDRLGSAIGWNALVVALSSASGPTIGALILSLGPWPWLFAVNLPLGALVILATRALPTALGTGRRIDGASVALHATGIATLIAGVELLPTKLPFALLLLAAASVTLTALARRELPREVPLIPFDLLRGASFRNSVIASVCLFAGVTAGIVALPFYLQHGLGRSVLATGLYMTAWPLTVAMTAPVSGRLAKRMPTGWLCAAGGTCLALGLAAASLWPIRGTLAPLVVFLMLCGMGFGLFNVPNNRNMYLSAPRARSGAAGGVQGTARLSGQTLGAVIMTLLFTLTSVPRAPRIGLCIGAALTLTAGLISTRRSAQPG